MHLDALLWLFLPVFVAGGSALLSFYIMQAKMEVALAKEREAGDHDEARRQCDIHDTRRQDSPSRCEGWWGAMGGRWQTPTRERW